MGSALTGRPDHAAWRWWRAGWDRARGTAPPAPEQRERTPGVIPCTDCRTEDLCEIVGCRAPFRRSPSLPPAAPARKLTAAASDAIGGDFEFPITPPPPPPPPAPDAPVLELTEEMRVSETQNRPNALVPELRVLRVANGWIICEANPGPGVPMIGPRCHVATDAAQLGQIVQALAGPAPT